MSLPDYLTVGRALSVPFVVLLFALELRRPRAAGRLGSSRSRWRRTGSTGASPRSRGRTSPLGSLLDPIADKILVLSVLIVLVGEGVFPGWMVAAIVAREFLVSGLRQAAIERGVVMEARDLGKLKTWSQAVAAGVGRSRRWRTSGATTPPGGRSSSRSC